MATCSLWQVRGPRPVPQEHRRHPLLRGRAGGERPGKGVQRALALDLG